MGALLRAQSGGLFFIYRRILSGSALLFGFHRLRVERDSMDIECNSLWVIFVEDFVFINIYISLRL